MHQFFVLVAKFLKNMLVTWVQVSTKGLNKMKFKRVRSRVKWGFLENPTLGVLGQNYFSLKFQEHPLFWGF